METRNLEANEELGWEIIKRIINPKTRRLYSRVKDSGTDPIQSNRCAYRSTSAETLNKGKGYNHALHGH